MMGKQQASGKIVVGYGVASLGTGVFSSVPGVLLLFFMTDTLGIAAGLATFAVLIPKIWDIFTDPLMGYVSDHTHSRWGRRHPYLVAGALTMGIAFPLLFTVSEGYTSEQSFYYVLVMFTFGATAFTLFQIPYVAMGAELSDQPSIRTRIMSYRMAFMIGGNALGLVVAPLLVGAFGGGRHGYSMMAIIVGIFCMVCMLTTSMMTRRLVLAEPTRSKLSPRQQFRHVMQNRPYVMLLCSYMSFITGIGLVGAAIPYYVANILGEGEQMIGIVFLAWLLGSLFMLPLWTFCAAKTGKKVALQLAVLLFCFAAVLIFTVGVGIAKSGLLIAIGCMGIAYGGMQVLPFSMLTDTIQFDSQKNGGNRAGAFSGIWIASEKIGLAIGAAAMGMLLSSAGYVQKTGGSVEQPEAVAEAILMGLSIYPAICIATGFGFLIFYSLRGSDLVQQEIVEP